jgi:hypothetical protein
MARLPKKYEEGSVFEDIAEAADWIDRGYYLWWRHGPMHPAWISGWPFRFVAAEMKIGRLKKAKITAARLRAVVAREMERVT